MGKGTILEHLGDGQYRVRLLRDTARVDARIAEITASLASVEANLSAAADAEAAALAALTAAQDAINQLIHDAEEANSGLLDALQAAVDALADATDAVSAQQELIEGMVDNQQSQLDAIDGQIDVLEAELAEAETDEQRESIQSDIDALQLERDAVEAATNSEIAAATSDLSALRADQREQQTTTDGAQQAWDDRDQKIDEINQAIADAAPLQTAYFAARDKRAGLQLRLISLQKEIEWVSANLGTNPELTAWCADLTEDLEGAVATIEIPGERKEVPVLIRPGYQGRADWQSAEQHAALVSAVTNAQSLVLDAEVMLDMTRLNRDAQRQRVEAAEDYLAIVSARVSMVPELIASAQAQLDAADAALEVAEDAIPPADAAVAAAEATLSAARAALQSARDAAAEPDASPEARMADGQLQPVISSSPWATFWNWALLPAWQKWKPMCRIGEITALNGDTCTVQLDAATSSQQSIDINREETLQDVPILYMECNAEAFEVGDRVVVEFAYHDQTKPRVIGFESNPRECFTAGILVDIRGRTPGQNVNPSRLGAQAAGTPPSIYDPYGFWPADSGSAIEYVRLSYKSAWSVKFRYSKSPDVVFGNRRHHSWDGTRYLGAVSWLQKSAFGGEWYSRPGTWAGPIIPQGQTPPAPESDYLIDKATSSAGFAHGDIAYRGALILKAQMLTSGLSGVTGMRVVAACIVNSGDALVLRVITWHWAAKSYTYAAIMSAAGLAYNRPPGADVPKNWRTNTEFVEPARQLFVCWEGPFDADDEPARRAGMAKTGEFSGADPVWVPNPNDSTAYDLAYIDSSEAVRPETPLGQFAKSGTKATAIYVGGAWWLHNVLNAQIYMDWAWGAGAVVRFEWPLGGSPSATFTTQQGDQISSSTLSVAEIYDPVHEWYTTISSTWSRTASTTEASTTAVAVDYDDEDEVLLWYAYSGAASSTRSSTESDSGEIGSFSETVTVTHTLTSTNEQIDITITDQGSTLADFDNGSSSGRSSTLLIHAVDLVSGEIYYTQWRGGTDQSLAPGHGLRRYSSREVTVYHNAEILLHDETYELSGYGNVNPWWDSWSWGGPYTTATVSSSSTAPWGFDVTRGHIEIYHYGKGPSVAYARDQLGHYVGAISHNEWAPLVSYTGYRTAGGFLPNTTTQHLYSDIPSVEALLQTAKLSALETAAYSIGLI